MKAETFISYRKYLWFWIVTIATLALLAWYYIDVPVGGRSGSTTFGYSSGIIAALAIAYLMWFGIRKRSYYSYKVTLKGWLAAHIWIGVALLIIVPLHAAFEFGLNIHTAAYIFLVLVVLSGIAGAFFYRFLPAETLSNRGAGAIKKRVEEVESLNQEIDNLAQNKSLEFSNLVQELDTKCVLSLRRALFGKDILPIDQRLAADKLSQVKLEEREDAAKIISLLAKKRIIAAGIQDEIIVRAKLKAWLFAHIPLSLGLCILVVVHIFSIFYFR